MKIIYSIALTLTTLFTLSCANNSGSSETNQTQQNVQSEAILLNGVIGQFNGSFISHQITRTELFKDGTQKISTRSLSLTIEQRQNSISITVYNGVGTTGISLVSFDHLNINKSTQNLSKDGYPFKGLIGENAFRISNEGLDYSNGSDSNGTPYMQSVYIKKISQTKIHMKLEIKNNYIGNTFVYNNIFEGDFDLE